jgi:hypothetical protein
MGARERPGPPAGPCVTRGRRLTEEQFGQALASFGHTAFRLELQSAYAEPCEADLLAAWNRGERPDPAETVPELRDWYEQVAGQARAGKRVERVRVQRLPPTPYQQFERWLDRWNLGAGEVMRYITRSRAEEIGLLPAAGDTDWWLLDSSRLVVMRFDRAGRRVGTELVTNPKAVIKACAWRDLAVHHSVQEHLSDVPA